MTLQAEDKRKLKFGAVWLWCIGKGYEEKVQYIYIVIDDDSKYQSLKKLVPEFCGVFCNSNTFGLGMVTQIKRQTKRKVRRSESFPNGNGYRKCIEYQWQFW